MNSGEIVFEGVVIGYEKLDIYGEVLYVTGRVNSVDCFFYLIAPRSILEEYVLKGIGRLISGKGIIINENPLVIKYISGGE